jgi:peptide/nickel transport system permease protein
MGLVPFVAKRLLFAVLAMLVVSMAVYALLLLSPGSPEQVLLGGSNPTPEALAAVREKYHLDDPIYAQYWRWLNDAIRGDLGTSVQGNEEVTHAIWRRLPTSLTLAGMALLFTFAVAVPLGILAAARRGKAADRSVAVVSTIGVSSPTFVVSIVMLYVFGVWLDLFPIYGAGSGFIDRVWHLVLPSAALSFSLITFVTRQTRAAALHVFDRDYMTSARARGIAPRTMWGRYVLRNSSLPVVTSAGIVLAFTLTGTVIVEKTFSIAGLGSLIVDAVNSKDIPVVQGLALFAAGVVVLTNLAVDLAYLALDPRVRRSVVG